MAPDAGRHEPGRSRGRPPVSGGFRSPGTSLLCRHGVGTPGSPEANPHPCGHLGWRRDSWRLTVPLCAINGFLIDGNFWFWSPSFRTAGAVMQNYIWPESIWREHRLVPWLWLPIASAAVAVVSVCRWRAMVKRRDFAGVMVSAQLLLALAFMAALQMRGITLLGHYYYACYLFPFAFLVSRQFVLAGGGKDAGPHLCSWHVPRCWSWRQRPGTIRPAIPLRANRHGSPPASARWRCPWRCVNGRPARSWRLPVSWF